MGDFDFVKQPQPGQEDYGTKYSDNPSIIMEKTISSLAYEYALNKFATYPIGFYKVVILSGKKYDEIENILCEVTGLNKEEVKTRANEFFSSEKIITGPFMPIEPSKNLNYEQFGVLMEKVDKLLGGGSRYSEMYRTQNAQVPITYEEALSYYQEIIDKDQVTGAYARLFCDYMGIILAILPVFIAVTRGLRDRRARAHEVIYAHKVSSFHVIVSRYTAMVVMLFLPVLVLSLYPLSICIYHGSSLGVSIDFFAFITYSVVWLLPTILVSLSVGVLFTELTETAIAIILHGFWWFVSIFTGVSQMGGGYGMNLIPRHNIVGNYEVYQEHFQILVTNRIFYTILALLLMVASVFVYEMKRKGKLHVRRKIFANRNSQL
jgi:hypothetical protein